MILGRGNFSIPEIRSYVELLEGDNMIIFPGNSGDSIEYLFKEHDIWGPPNSLDDLDILLEALMNPTEWKAHETREPHKDLLQRTNLIHHFHLDVHKKKRSEYRWFAFRDVKRFGNVWFNLGGSKKPWKELESIWAGDKGFKRLHQLYPWVSQKYHIRTHPEVFPTELSKKIVNKIWGNLTINYPDIYPILHIWPNFYLCPGQKLNYYPLILTIILKNGQSLKETMEYLLV